MSSRACLKAVWEEERKREWESEREGEEKWKRETEPELDIWQSVCITTTCSAEKVKMCSLFDHWSMTAGSVWETQEDLTSICCLCSGVCVCDVRSKLHFWAVRLSYSSIFPSLLFFSPSAAQYWCQMSSKINGQLDAKAFQISYWTNYQPSFKEQGSKMVYFDNQTGFQIRFSRLCYFADVGWRVFSFIFIHFLKKHQLTEQEQKKNMKEGQMKVRVLCFPVI